MDYSIEERADSYFEDEWRLVIKEEYRKAEGYLRACLDIEPRHAQARITLGEMYLLHNEELGIADEDADQAARIEFEAALAVTPTSADAWSGLALTLLYMEDFEGALRAADEGLRVIAVDTTAPMYDPAVFMNVAESLHDVRVRAYVEMGMTAESEAALELGLLRCVGSAFLMRHKTGVYLRGEDGGRGKGHDQPGRVAEACRHLSTTCRY